MKNSRVFVGTMHSGEGEFERCKEAVKRQKNIELTHFIINDRPEHVAARELYSTWNSLKSSYDFFVQVDADTILRHDHVLIDCINTLTNNPNFTSLQAPLFDHMINGFIQGLNVYSTSVIFKESVDNLYTDRATENNVTMLSGFPDSILPAGDHVSAPTDAQAFHYGVHRGLKNQEHIKNKVRFIFVQDPKRFRGLALLGFQRAHKFVSSDGKKTDFNYADDLFKQELKEVSTNYENLVKQFFG